MLIAWYALATLPYLGNFPLPTQDEAQIASPGYKLALHGVYGQDLYAGYYRSEQYVYEFPPLHPLLLALGFKLIGFGLGQARLVSVLCGLATLLLTFALGRRLYGPAVGLGAAAVLAALRVSLEPRLSGMPLLDAARVIRYDIVVPPLVLGAMLCFLRAELETRGGYGGAPSVGAWYLVAGLLAGLATLGHVYGAFILLPLGGLLLWRQGWRAVLRPAPWLLAAGWALALLPWLLYALRDPAAYYGQTLVDQSLGRYDVLNPAFYWRNLLSEYQRYLRLLGPDGSGLLQPRVGIWLLGGGVLGANILLLRRLCMHRSAPLRLCGEQLSDRLLLITPLGLGAALALLVNLKDHRYLLLLLPFVAVQVAFALHELWCILRRRPAVLRLLYALVLLAALAEGGAGVARLLRRAAAASPYNSAVAEVARLLPPGARVMAVGFYWFGLAGFETRTLDLPFRFSNPLFYKPQPLPMAQALRQVAPEYLLVDPLVERYVFDPHQPGDSAILLRQKRELTREVRRHCADLVGVVDRPAYADYAPLKLYRCDWR
jgi:4-amino-4-deoxy-L-arabinose transferase-like glycosyltransferase